MEFWNIKIAFTVERLDADENIMIWGRHFYRWGEAVTRFPSTDGRLTLELSLMWEAKTIALILTESANIGSKRLQNDYRGCIQHCGEAPTVRNLFGFFILSQLSWAENLGCLLAFVCKYVNLIFEL